MMRVGTLRTGLLLLHGALQLFDQLLGILQVVYIMVDPISAQISHIENANKANNYHRVAAGRRAPAPSAWPLLLMRNRQNEICVQK